FTIANRLGFSIDNYFDFTLFDSVFDIWNQPVFCSWFQIFTSYYHRNIHIVAVEFESGFNSTVATTYNHYFLKRMFIRLYVIMAYNRQVFAGNIEQARL